MLTTHEVLSNIYASRFEFLTPVFVVELFDDSAVQRCPRGRAFIPAPIHPGPPRGLAFILAPKVCLLPRTSGLG